MIRNIERSRIFTAAVGVWLCSVAFAQMPARRNLITESIDNEKRVTLRGNIRPEVRTAIDRGRVADNLTIEHITLVLKRTPEQEAAAKALIDDLTNHDSPNFHRWITAAQYGQRFGLSQQDLDAVTHWLKSQGFTVNMVYESGGFIDFSGPAASVRTAFGTEIHSLEVDGDVHFANTTDPSIPLALANAVHGVMSLHNFHPKPMAKKAKPAYSFSTSGSPVQALVPSDLWTIYNFSPTFAAGYTGKGQTIVLIENTFLYSVNDWTTFRKEFGMARTYPYGTLTQTAPQCTAPAATTNDSEAAIDVEWASAAAPNANLVLLACEDASGAIATFGGFQALQNILNSPNPPSVVSISYGAAESLNGPTTNAAITDLYQLGAARGVSIFVSAGDGGAAMVDAGTTSATHGINVNGYASTAFNTAVGGTDFADSFLGTTSNYWNSTNNANFGSARSYIPEIPWNNSCASQLLTLSNGYASSAGPSGFCNSNLARTNNEFLDVAAGGGGPSGCGSGTSATTGVTDGTCVGYAKPTWQSVFGNPADGVRDIPDVSLFGSTGVWQHYYIVCYSHTGGGFTGKPCTGAPSTWTGMGGTSFTAPIMAGIQALINQATARSWGNVTSEYYALAKAEYGSSGNAACNSEAAGGPATSCIFYDSTLGDNDVNCSLGTTQGSVLHNCYNTGGTQGVLSTSNVVLQPAYSTTVGWDFATGLGSVNTFNLLNGFLAIKP